MAKFYGIIGYVGQTESVAGVYSEEVTEKAYKGDILRNTKRWERTENLNDDLAVNNLFSIVADSFAIANLQAMRYVKWSGSSWKITNVEIQRPRIIITIGGIYNGNEA